MASAAITGYGLVSPAGEDHAAFTRAIERGTCTFGPLPGMRAPSGCPAIGLGFEGPRGSGRAQRMLLDACGRALAHGAADETAVFVGTSLGDIDSALGHDAGDEDGDGFTNAEEEAGGSDPNDPNDVPYAGGWQKDLECADSIVSTGNELGQVAEDFTLLDQFGEELSLHDFCNHVVLIEFSGFT